ncbi:MAG: hypothetical protein D6762_03100 [Candidatus Neomarinimicrobiota bacterium]|nr:MAG: hypothetical protein D6762_03100 [Candidatus Neomarinimicrobiota bacterium]
MTTGPKFPSSNWSIWLVPARKRKNLRRRKKNLRTNRPDRDRSLILPLTGRSRKSPSFFLLLFFIPWLLGAQALHFQHRYLWVVRNTLTSREKIDDLIQFASRNGFTDLLVQVRGRGDALYRSRLVPTSPLLRHVSFDPLSYILEQAHARQLRVHAWVNVYVVWSPNQQSTPAGHLIYEHPNWFDEDYARSDLPENGKNVAGDPDEGYYLAPDHPQVSSYLLSVFREIVALYPVDGLHLDYIRYKGAPYGYNPEAVAAYQDRYGKDPRKVVLNFKRMPDNPLLRTEKEHWDDYRRNAVTQLVKQVHAMVGDVRPGCIVSVAVKPDLNQAREKFYQEWDVWLAAGYVDWAIPMNYTADLHDFAYNIDVIYENLPEKYRNRILMGVALYNQSPLDVHDKLIYTQVTRFPGFSLFSYNTLAEKPEYIRRLHLSTR